MAETTILILLRRHRQGDERAAAELLAHTSARVRLIARSTLREFGLVRTLQETDDVFHEAIIKLQKALLGIRPENSAAFFGLVGLKIRQVLLDMAVKAKRRGRQKPLDDEAASPAARGGSPSEEARVQEIHEIIGNLPEHHRIMFDLLFYDGVTQAQAAEILKIAVPTVKKHYHAAKIALDERLNRR